MVLPKGQTAATAGSRAAEEIAATTRLALYRSQFEIRAVEKRAYDLFLQNLIKGTSHLAIGQEAIAAGFAVQMKPGDWSFCTYRGHAHTLARGASMTGVLGELMGRECGLMGGKGGSMHLTDVSHGVMGSYAIVGAHLPIAMGAAWSAQYRGTDQVAVCFFGDGTTNIGAFHEALSMAATWKLPVVFVCENNLYMEYTPISAVTPVKNPAADRASAYGLDRNLIDGNDADEVYRTAQSAIARARSGAGPSLIEAVTYRHHGHSRADPAKYRPADEVEAWMKRDPIPLYRQRLIDFGVAESTILDIEEKVKNAVDHATEVAKGSRPPADELIYKDVWADGGWAWRN
jgi:TPP-dependent pyruvate/acetoin dehydrogenase alpha subunit